MKSSRLREDWSYWSLGRGYQLGLLLRAVEELTVWAVRLKQKEKSQDIKTCRRHQTLLRLSDALNSTVVTHRLPSAASLHAGTHVLGEDIRLTALQHLIQLFIRHVGSG